MQLGVDTGGTFTDFVLLADGSLRLHKVLSTPDDPSRAILQGIEDLGLSAAAASGRLRIIHGSTVATNAALEGKGARTVLVTNSGFTDLLAIGRQARRQLYSLAPTEPPAPLDPALAFGLPGRLAADGSEVAALPAAALADLQQQLATLAPEAVAVCLLHAWANPEHEQQVLEALEGQPFVCASHQVLPRHGEYERAMASYLNAWLGPLVARYLTSLQDGLGSKARLAVMQSSGGTIAAPLAARRAVNLLLSGPAGGLAAAARVAEGALPLLTFDMGGTSTDVALVAGSPTLTHQGSINGWPVAVPMVDMHTIGAGGGSIASRDAGGALQVGPESAGADPGPACYGRGGQRATVSDANAVLGRLRPDAFLGGRMALDLPAAEQAIAALAADLGLDPITTANGIIELANNHMAQALRVISLEQGADPRQHTLCCFGGAGGLHVCALADQLGMQRILVPRFGGVLSAFGMLVAPARRTTSRTLRQPLDRIDAAHLAATATALADTAADELAAEGHDPAQVQHRRVLELCYAGQGSTLALPWAGQPLADRAAAFEAEHARRYGHRLRLPVELVELRLESSHPPATLAMPELSGRRPAAARATAALPDQGAVPVWDRAALAAGQTLAAPALITEETATTWLAPGWLGRVDRHGHLHLTRPDPS